MFTEMFRSITSRPMAAVSVETNTDTALKMHSYIVFHLKTNLNPIELVSFFQIILKMAEERIKICVI